MFAKRFIPVGTGNTFACATQCANSPVHPRGHGEHISRIFKLWVTRGSSPWARGTLADGLMNTQPVRFIPVGTGNTHLSWLHLTHLTVHPRGHGEHGKDSPTRFVIERFIPVGTGNTQLACICAVVSTVHPRGHGEHDMCNGKSDESGGSSPWARGTLLITPDCAALSAVHPRGHGEHYCIGISLRLSGGSSPWARGTPSVAVYINEVWRFIPVGTGNTHRSHM